MKKFFYYTIILLSGSIFMSTTCKTASTDLGFIPVTRITITPSTAVSVDVGGVAVLGFTITPTFATKKTVSWSSNNPAIATVNALGVVTGVAAGNATICATAEDGSGIMGSIVVTVKALTYSISASPNPSFGSLQTPYAQPVAQSVTVTNTGTGAVTLNALPTVPNYTLLGFSTGHYLPAGASVNFTVHQIPTCR